MSTASTHDVEKEQPLPAQEETSDVAPRRGSEQDHGEAKAAGASAPAASQDAVAHSPSPMNYPFDENLFHSGNPDAVESSAAVNEGDEELPYPQPSTAEELVHPPDFKPLFTLIEDPETSEHHHPTVHYVFSDDDPEVMTNAALDALAAHENDNDDSRSPSEKDEENGEQEERCVFLDMAADGKTVVSASSLSPGWQALRTSVTQAPSWGEVGNDGDGRLLLKISGQEIGASRRARAKQKQQQQQEEQRSEAGLDELVKMFGYRLEGLEQVMESTREKDEDEDHRTI